MESDHLHRGSGTSFRDSTHLIPSADSKGTKPTQYTAWFMSWFISLGTPLLILATGIALEVATISSYKRGGFKVPPTNVFPLVSPQFLLSFVPAIIILPQGYLWRVIVWGVRWLQPYLLLWKGRSPAEESLLLDYVRLSPLLGLFRALKYRHRIVLWSCVTALVTYGFQPLAGAIFQLRQQKQKQATSVMSTKNLGLIPDVNDLSAFIAAAGFSAAAVFQGLPDPPFIDSQWAAAQFSIPTDPGLNGTLAVNTTGIITTTNCANPVSTHLVQIAPNQTSVNSNSVDGCSVNVTYDPTASGSQYGVQNVPCPGSAATAQVAFQPVMFWFFHNKTDGTPEVKTVFCTPSIKVFNITASVNLNDNSLSHITPLDQYAPSNNVTGDPLDGKAFNGVIFPDDTDPFIQARSIATKSEVSGAIFRFASQQAGGVQASFALPNGLLDATVDVYTRHLSVVAKTVYFVDANTTLSAEMSSLTPVLWVDPFPAHTLAFALIFVGCIGIVIQILHQRERRKVLITAPPGSIGAVVSLTARSGFGELLHPYDDEATLERKLRGLTFRSDRRTGAIVVDDDDEGIYSGPDDAMLLLLGQNRQSRLRDTTASSSSSATAYQAASGYPPWKTPYDP